jgi:hypothetical protein
VRSQRVSDTGLTDYGVAAGVKKESGTTMEPSLQQDSLPLVTPTAKEMQMPIFVTRWLREHKADNGKRG